MKAVIVLALFVTISALPHNKRPVRVPDIPVPVLHRYWEPAPEPQWEVPPLPRVNPANILEAILSELGKSSEHESEDDDGSDERVTQDDIINALNILHQIIQNHGGENAPSNRPDDVVQNETNGDASTPPVPNDSGPDSEEDSASDDSQEDDEQPSSSSAAPQDEDEQPSSSSAAPQDEDEQPSSSSAVPQDEDEQPSSSSAAPHDEDEQTPSSSASPQDGDEQPSSSSAAPQDDDEQPSSSSAAPQDEDEPVYIARRSAPIQISDVTNFDIEIPAISNKIQSIRAKDIVHVVEPHLRKPLRLPLESVPEDIKYNLPTFTV